MSFSVTIPLAKPLPSAANLREHWAAKAKRVKAQRDMVRLALTPKRAALRALADGADVWSEPLRLRVRFVRIASRKLDDDNLAYAFKAHRDEVAKMAGLDDAWPGWRWEYAQERGEPAIRIEVEGVTSV